MPFKDNKEDQTHVNGDGCGEPSPDYPIGGLVERYDIEKEDQLCNED